MEATQGKRPETSPHNTEIKNQDGTLPVEGTDIHRGARPKTKHNIYSHKNSREYNRIWRSKSCIDIDTDGKRPKQYRENKRQRWSNLEDQSTSGLGSSTGKLNWKVSQSSKTRFKEGYNNIEPKHCLEHTHSVTYEETGMWRGRMFPSGSSLRSSRQGSHAPLCKQSNRKNRQEVTDGLTEEGNKGLNLKKTDTEAEYQRISYPERKESMSVDKSENEELLEPDVYLEKLRSNIENKEAQGKRKGIIIGYPSLKSLLEKDPEYIILELTKVKSSLQDCIARTSKEMDFLKLFLGVVSKAFTSSKTPKVMISLFETLRENRFFDTVILYLIDVMEMTREKNTNKSETEEILQNIMTIISEQLTRNPSSFRVFERLSTIIGQVIETLMKYGSVDDAIVSKHQEIIEEKKRLEKKSSDKL